MTTRRRFTGEFKARVALDALRGDKTVQEIAARHKVHPNQVSTWKRQAVDGLSEVFSNGADHERQDRETEVRDLHAKIGQLTVERDLYEGFEVKRDAFLVSVTAPFLRPGLAIFDASRAGAVRTGRRPPPIGGLVLTGSSTARCWA
jgi:transposase